MKKDTSHLEPFRIVKGQMASGPADGMNGAFRIPHPHQPNLLIQVIASDGGGWDHVSVVITLKTGKPIRRTPTWEEMCAVKDAFFAFTETAIQYHPEETEYTNDNPHCLHLWRPNDGTPIPTPPTIMV